MPTLSTIDEWLHQAQLLLKAYPSTTIITTKYNLPHPRKLAKLSARRRARAKDTEAPVATDPQQPPEQDTAPEKESSKREREGAAAAAHTASLEVRAYNPQVGVVLKYRTRKAWEVGRLVHALTVLGRVQAALPEGTQETEGEGGVEGGGIKDGDTVKEEGKGKGKEEKGGKEEGAKKKKKKGRK